MAIKTPKKIRKDFDIKGGFTTKDIRGVVMGIGAGMVTSLMMITPLRLIWISLVTMLSVWLMLPNKEVNLKHWQVIFLIVTNPVKIYIAERDSRRDKNE